MTESTQSFSGQEARKGSVDCSHSFMFLLILALLLSLVAPPSLWSQTTAGPKAKKQPAAKTEPAKDAAVTDANIQAQLKKAQELFKAKNYDGALKPYQDTYNYTKEVLPLVRFMKGQYEKASSQPSVPQAEKEEVYIKLRRAGQFITKYETIHNATLYPLGFIYAKKGVTEKAKQYLKEAVETLPFSLNPDSPWMKSKTLLLNLYQLEGEF